MKVPGATKEKSIFISPKEGGNPTPGRWEEAQVLQRALLLEGAGLFRIQEARRMIAQILAWKTPLLPCAGAFPVCFLPCSLLLLLLSHGTARRGPSWSGAD